MRIAIEPHEEIVGRAPFLLKPLENRQNRFQIQAYRPKQLEVMDIELSVGWHDEDEEQENQWQLEALQEEIKNEQIFEKKYRI